MDVNVDMVCDKCSSSLPFDDYMEAKTLEAFTGENTAIKLFGSMPKDAYTNFTAINKEEAFAMAQKYISIEKEDILYAYDIFLNSPTMEYAPVKYGKSVRIELSNIKLEKDKEYAMLHVIDSSNYEILPIQKLGNDTISFNASSFSPYILITVEGHSVTFDGENYKVYDTQGNEITNGATVASGTNFNFTIVPNDKYGITDVTCVNAASESVIEVSGYIKGKTGKIVSVTEDLTIYVTTILAPEITTQPQTAKIESETTATFTVVAENATTYQWQYRENRDEYWKDVTSSMGSGYASATYTTVAVDYEYSGYEFRCLVGTTDFMQHERITSDIVTLIVVQDDIVVGETPVILIQPNMENGKVKIDSGKGTYSVTALGNNLTFTWQYRENRDTYWKTMTSSIGNASTTTVDSSTTNPIQKSTLTTVTGVVGLNGYEFRCLVGNTYYANHDAVKSDIVTLIVTEDDITSQVKYHDMGIKTQPQMQKVSMGTTATYAIEKTSTSTINKYKWQYKPSEDSMFWLDVDSTLGTGNTVASGYSTATLSIDTSNMTLDEETLEVANNLSGYLFRCVVSDSSLTTVTKNSDVAMLSVTQDDIIVDNIKVKTAPTLEITETDITVENGKSKEITFKYDGDGTLSVTPADSTIATATIEGTVIKIDGLKIGNTTITVSASAGETYSSASKTINITVIEEIKLIFSTIVVENYENMYDGKAHGISLTGSELEGATVVYSLSEGVYDLTEAPTYVDAGTYTIYFKVSKDGYEDYEGSAQVKITPKEVEVVATSLKLIYNGSIQRPTVNVDSGVDGEKIIVGVYGGGADVGFHKATVRIESVEGGQGKVGNYKLVVSGN